MDNRGILNAMNFIKYLGSLIYKAIQFNMLNGNRFILIFVICVICGLYLGCSSSSKPPQAGAPTKSGVVVLYCSHDWLFSEPIVKEFERRSGLKVDYKYDGEASKTVGLVNKLIARKEHPECDVYWNNELGQTLVLKERGILEAYRPQAAAGLPERFRDADGWWTGFAARARVILYNTELVKPEDAPKGLLDLTHPRFKSQGVMAEYVSDGRHEGTCG